MPPKRKNSGGYPNGDSAMTPADGSSDTASGGKASQAAAHDGPAAVDGRPPDETDNANYFCEYAYLYHQMDMLEDAHRTGSYNNAVSWNPGCFENKVVLDVGAGSGILSMMAARAGAKHVYAVEATDMAKRAGRICEANGLGSVITVLQGTMETVKLPCKVDVIISEWMGYLLLRESMLDSVLLARDRYLKEGGSMFPSHATLYFAPIGQLKSLREKWQTFEGEQQHWAAFSGDMKTYYDMDFSCMKDEFFVEQRKYYLQTGSFVNLTPKNLIGPGRPVMELDLHHVTLEELQNPTEPLRCAMKIGKDGPVEGFTGYFDTFFRGSRDNPCEREVALSTAPQGGMSTHWGQQLFGFFPPFQAFRGDTLECEVFIKRQEKNHRLLKLETSWKLYGQPHGSASAEATQRILREQRKETYYVD